MKKSFSKRVFIFLGNAIIVLAFISLLIFAFTLGAVLLLELAY